ncbi:M23 family metallopeptidase [Methylotenera sp.]|uniref:M23 family metallopeptidase n=1 Tax=Methylotenera sp. TaxID=2051956 RepID=UPI0027361BCD|nr:M23 family metallopeptidase [Methylotenera sp.]MDP3778093.1 M23 family metallopeptidase [Methylotenera sp.]
MYINEPNHHQSTQDSILTQNANKAERKLQRLTARKFKLRWILAISCLPLFGIYTAFGIAPQTLTTNIATSMVVEEVSLPTLDQALNDEANLAEKFWYKDYVRRDDTLQSVLARLNIRNRDALEFIRSDSVASEIARSIIPGRQVKSETDADGNLFHFEYQISADQFLTITKTADGYEAHQDERILEIRPVLKSAKINSSLFGATDAANIPDHIAIQLADIFESEINFHTDLRRGDRFNVIYEGSYDQGELIKSGEVLAAEFVNNGKVYRAIGFRDSNNQMQYYTPEGKSIHKSFLRSPLEFSRVSSGFSVARFHPVLQRMRAHKGVDFAAPTGTRIKASADAVVDFVGTKGGYGNVIILKHDNGISTVYGHLSRFAPELRRGSKVTQGQMIGFVGMSGVATGPHLHYEFLINGKHQDPMKVALPKNNTIQGGNKAQFETISNQMMAQLRLLGTSNIAALE